MEMNLEFRIEHYSLYGYQGNDPFPEGTYKFSIHYRGLEKEPIFILGNFGKNKEGLFKFRRGYQSKDIEKVMKFVKENLK